MKFAYTEADQQNWTKRELEDYLRASIKERDEIGRIEFAVRKAEKKGEMKGRIEVAKKMLQKGISKIDIMDFTGFSNTELDAL